jgi:hypothetical protein
MGVVATFHLLRWRGMRGMITALAGDRMRYRRVPDLKFLRVLGTGRGSNTAPGAQFDRTALFCVFDGNDADAAADSFVSRVQARNGLIESWHVKMRGAGGHGSWRGTEIPRMMPTTNTGDAATMPIAIITRADVRLRSWRSFSQAAEIVDRELQQSPGLLAVVGVGEAPILRLGTFSLWRDTAAMTSFGHRAPLHADVVQRTRRGGWYGEEMFARFTPYWSAGTWDGRDPLRMVSAGNSIP